MNNKVSFDGYTISQAAHTFHLFYYDFQRFLFIRKYVFDAKKGMYSISVELIYGSQMNFKNETSDIHQSVQSTSDMIKFV